MKFKKQVAAAVILSAMQLVTVSSEAAAIDEELAVVAAEQADAEVFNVEQENSADDTKKNIEPPPPVVESEPVAEPEQPAPVAEPVQPAPVAEPVQPAPVAEPVQPAPVAEPVQPAPVAEPVQPDKAVTLQNSAVDYKNFDALVSAVKFVPLYIPKKSGYTINAMSAIDNKVAEISYGRRWEPEVSLKVRTYKRQGGEELKDISGVNGVTWRIDMTSGTAVYIAKIDERSHVAAWSSGEYTFSAHVENLSFAAFHSLVIDELVDLSAHYFVKIAD